MKFFSRQPRRILDEALLASYQSPPTIVEVEVAGRWSPAVTAPVSFPYYVVLSSNPYSEILSPRANRRRQRRVLRHCAGSNVLPARAIDPSGQWPMEVGVAWWGADDQARRLARYAHQFAYYEVTTAGLVVRVVD